MTNTRPILDIKPFQGVGPFHFGMSPKEVDTAGADYYGPVLRSRKGFTGSLIESRGVSAPKFTYRGEGLSEIELDYRCSDVYISGIDVFSEPPKVVLNAFRELDPNPMVYLDSIGFLSIGVNTSGFYDVRTKSYTQFPITDQFEKGVVVFAQGTFDALSARFESFELP